jgi:hypothetical protein
VFKVKIIGNNGKAQSLNPPGNAVGNKTKTMRILVKVHILIPPENPEKNKLRLSEENSNCRGH